MVKVAGGTRHLFAVHLRSVLQRSPHRNPSACSRALGGLVQGQGAEGLVSSENRITLAVARDPAIGGGDVTFYWVASMESEP